MPCGIGLEGRILSIARVHLAMRQAVERAVINP